MITTNDLTIGNRETTDTGGTSSLSILAPGENADAILYFGTQYESNATNAKKAAIIAEGNTTSGVGYSRSKLHFCLDNTGNNSSTYNASISNSRMCILHNGNVGIGTTNPDTPLHIETAPSGGQILKLSTTQSDSACWLELECKANNSPEEWGITSNINGKLQFYKRVGTGAGNYRMTITGDGNVGIGTDSPSNALEVATTNSHNSGWAKHLKIIITRW